MGYLHIDGRGMKPNGGSRHNPLEAETIAAWLGAHKVHLGIGCRRNTPLENIEALVLPELEKLQLDKRSVVAIASVDLKKDEQGLLTVGTVHSLQGAERAIVLFSPVYSKHEDGRFLDSNSTILNVAVSRAKDSFLVFGDMDLIEMQPAFSPRGLLAKYLFSSDNNALQFEFQKRQDLISAHTQISTLHGVEQHDEFLNKTLAGAQKKITIISPWLSWQKVEQTGFLASMALARSRGIDITVVTDKNCNIAHVDDDKRQEKQHLLNDAVEKLNKMGIATKLVNRVHSKIVIEDEELLCVGSFNWFSATREDKYQRYDTSLVYRGEGVKNEIKAIYGSLDQRQL